MVSFVIAQIVVVSLHLRAMRLDYQTQEIQLARGLYREFYIEEKPYLQLANAIESCKTLYKGDGDSFGHLQINEYLGFFSDLGLFMQRGALSQELIGHFFGAFIVEAYKYPEIKLYIDRIRKNFHQPEAFAEFAGSCGRDCKSRPFARRHQDGQHGSLDDERQPAPAWRLSRRAALQGGRLTATRQRLGVTPRKFSWLESDKNRRKSLL